MKPKSQQSSGQNDLFRIRLADLLDQRHELYQLADLIDWEKLDQEFGTFFCTSDWSAGLADSADSGIALFETCIRRIG